MNQTELLALIQQAKDEQWTELDLRGQYLLALPPEIGELTQLEVLNLGYLEKPLRFNYLSVLPEWMGQNPFLPKSDVVFNGEAKATLATEPTN